MNFTTNNNGRAFRSPEGFVIRRDTLESPAYWKAYDPNGKEIAGAAGDQGWLKCVEYSRRLHALNEHAKQPRLPTEAAPSSNNDSSPQQGLEL